MTLIACGPPSVRAVRDCVTCGNPRWMVGSYGINYGIRLTCVICGGVYDSEGHWDRPEPEPAEPLNWQMPEARARAARDRWGAAAMLETEIARQEREWGWYATHPVSPELPDEYVKDEDTSPPQEEPEGQ